MRDQRQTKEYFDSMVSFYIGVESESENRLDNNTGIKDGNRPLAVYGLIGDSVSLLVARYSRGDALETLRPQVERLIERRAALNAEIEARPQAEQKSLAQFVHLGLDGYVRYLWIFSFAVNLGLPRPEIVHLLELVGHAGEDALFDRLAQKFQPERPIGPELRFAKPYQPLFDALDAAPDKRAKLMKTFLDKWYPSIKSVGWWGGFEKGSDGYFGYWCFEAALAVRLFGIDDSSFADHPYYPKDLAQFGRSS